MGNWSEQQEVRKEVKEKDKVGTFIKYYKISQLIHTQSIAN